MLVIFENYPTYRDLSSDAAGIAPRANAITVVEPPAPVTWEDVAIRQNILRLIEPAQGQMRLRRAFEDALEEVSPGRPESGILWPRYASFVTNAS